MPDRNVFSRDGHAYYSRKLKDSGKKVANSGKAVGEAAGDNCDWHDNFAYEDSMRTLERDSVMAADLRKSLELGDVIDIVEQRIRVAIGNTVELEYEDGESREITIGAWGESSPSKGLVSYTAPLAKAVIGKTEGDEGRFGTRGTVRAFTVNKIHPASYKYRELIRALFADINIHVA